MTDTIETQSINKIRTANRDWAEAITLWLESRRSVATRRSYAKALQDLLVHAGVMPWEITRTHVLRWVQDQALSGHAATTISQRLAGISSFYKFCMTEYYVGSTASTSSATRGNQPLHDYNPAIGANLRPPIELYGKATWLDPEEVKAFLGAIYQGSLQGARDYALFLGYVLLSRRNSEWRQARWGDFEEYGNKVVFRWSGKGKTDQRLEVPAPVWYAVCDYLQRAGRLSPTNSPSGGEIQAGDYIFTALQRSGKQLPNGSTIEANRPICSHEVGRLLKRYLRLAGLQGKSIRPHSLRHTGAMLMQSAGASDREIMEFLGHRNLSITQVYLHTLKGRANNHWMTVAEILGLNVPTATPPIKGRRNRPFASTPKGE